METHDTHTPPPRRVGTFTFGVVLVLAGCAMLAAMFFPRLDLTWMVKLAPAALVSLGYTPSDAAAAVARVDETLPVQDIIKVALRGLSRV